MIEDNWVTVEQAPLEAVAEMMRGRLEAEGIEAVLRGNRVAGAAGIVNEFNISWQNPLGGVEVRVRPDDVPRAREILAIDGRSSADKTRARQTPWGIRAAGASLVAGVIYYLVEALSASMSAGVAAAVAGFVVVMAWGWSRDVGRKPR